MERGKRESEFRESVASQQAGRDYERKCVQELNLPPLPRAERRTFLIDKEGNRNRKGGQREKSPERVRERTFQKV